MDPTSEADPFACPKPNAANARKVTDSGEGISISEQEKEATGMGDRKRVLITRLEGEWQGGGKKERRENKIRM